MGLRETRIGKEDEVVERKYFTDLLYFEFLQKLHLPVGQVKNGIHQPDNKIH